MRSLANIKTKLSNIVKSAGPSQNLLPPPEFEDPSRSSQDNIPAPPIFDIPLPDLNAPAGGRQNAPASGAPSAPMPAPTRADPRQYMVAPPAFIYDPRLSAHPYAREIYQKLNYYGPVFERYARQLAFLQTQNRPGARAAENAVMQKMRERSSIVNRGLEEWYRRGLAQVAAIDAFASSTGQLDFETAINKAREAYPNAPTYIIGNEIIRGLAKYLGDPRFGDPDNPHVRVLATMPDRLMQNGSGALMAVRRGQIDKIGEYKANMLKDLEVLANYFPDAKVGDLVEARYLQAVGINPEATLASLSGKPVKPYRAPTQFGRTMQNIWNQAKQWFGFR